jgi:hypothetical protein
MLSCALHLNDRTPVQVASPIPLTDDGYRRGVHALTPTIGRRHGMMIPAELYGERDGTDIISRQLH